MSWLFIGPIVFIVSTVLTGWFAIVFKKSGIIDIPNERSSHITPTPRGGGLAIIIGILLGLFILLIFNYYNGSPLPIPGYFFWSGFVIVAITSFLDDKVNLPFYFRFILHFLAANLVFFETNGLGVFPLPQPFAFELGWVFNYPLTIVWIIAVLNIYNFLDGIDGYAATQAVVAGLAMAVLDFQGSGFTMGLLVSAAGLGFLIHNWKPAKIFMGDIGSAVLGFVFACTPFYFSFTETNIAIFSMGIFLWFFISDGSFTILRRLVQGEKIWVAHRTHLYQQWVIAGTGHDKVVLRVMSAAFSLSILFLLSYFFYPYWLIWILIPAFILYILYYFYVKKVIS